MYNYEIKTSFYILLENWILYDAIFNFLVWLRNSSNPPDMNWFQSYTGNDSIFFDIKIEIDI